MNDQGYSVAAQRLVNATNLADDDLSTFEADVQIVASAYLDQAARIAELESLVADALPLLEDEWSGVSFGDGVDWIARARTTLARDGGEAKTND